MPGFILLNHCKTCNPFAHGLIYTSKTNTMLYITISLFALAAVAGALILKNWLTSEPASRTTVYLHGIFAAAGLVLLIFFAFKNPDNYPKAGLILFVTGALVGFYMFAADLKKKFSPMWLAIVHALLGVSGFLMLLFFVFGG